MGTFSFNLVDEPWISGTDRAGKHLTFGIRIFSFKPMSFVPFTTRIPWPKRPSCAFSWR